VKKTLNYFNDIRSDLGWETLDWHIRTKPVICLKMVRKHLANV